MNIIFLGAAREVTGSRFLVEAEGIRFLVDCGRVQSGREAPVQTFVVHDEATAARVLAGALSPRPGWRVAVPGHGETARWPENALAGPQ